MQFRELTNQEYNNFVNNYPLKSIYQTPEYAFVMNNHGFDSVFLGMLKDGIVIAATLILIEKENGFKYAYAPRGFLINYDDLNLLKEFTIKIKSYLSKNGVMGIKINPMLIRHIFDFGNQNLLKSQKFDSIFNNLKNMGYYHLGFNNFFEALKPRFEAVIDIDKPIEILFKNVKKEFRTKIRSAIKNGIKVYRGSSSQLDILYNFTKDKYPRNLKYLQDCYEFYSKNSKIDLYYTKLDTKTYLTIIQDKLNFYEQKSNELNNLIIKQATNKHNNLINKKINADKSLNYYKNELVSATNLLRGYPEGIITACILVVTHGSEVTILIDGYDERFKKFNSKHLLIWQLIDVYKKQGYKRFNLGGISNMTVDESKYFGLNEFKLNFGAKMYEYAGDFELVTNKRSYNLYRNYVPLKKLIINKLTKE